MAAAISGSDRDGRTLFVIDTASGGEANSAIIFLDMVRTGKASGPERPNGWRVDRGCAGLSRRSAVRNSKKIKRSSVARQGER
jgi:hypothetical protein